MERLRQEVDAFSEASRLGPDLAFSLNLALEEIVTNIVFYGYDDKLTHEIRVDIFWKDGELTVQVEDDGRAFDPTMHPEPDLNVPVDQRRVGGLGIHLVRKFMDVMEYKRVGEKNILTLKKRSRPKESGLE